MHPLLIADRDLPARPILFVTGSSLERHLADLPATASRFARERRLEATPGAVHILPDADGGIAAVLLGVEEEGAAFREPFMAGALPSALPAGIYRFQNAGQQAFSATLGFVLGAYRFDRYRTAKAAEAKLVLADGVDGEEITRIGDAVALARDLVNTPASDLGPAALEHAVRALADAHGARFSSVVGDNLLADDFPMIHAVGRAAAEAPRLAGFVWGEESHPRVTLIGKGVCFDTGGLNIKPDNSMLLMKKDMGGAAAALAAAAMIMGARLPVRLRVLVPIVENAISGNAFRPGDVLHSRKGLTVEIGNTDAEGRLILADALALADEEAPDLLVDFATLTGAARVALGPDLPPFYTSDDILAADLQSLSLLVNDPVWRLPLWPPYDKMLASKIADVNHVSTGGYAGSITAALFLKRFVAQAKAYVHFDIFAWTPSPKPGRPEGGEAQGARLIYALVKERFGG